MSKSLSAVTAQNLPIFTYDVARFNALLSCPSSFQYSNPFRNSSATIKIFRKNANFLDYNWLPWQRPLGDRKMKAGFTSPYTALLIPEKLVKIHLVLPEICLLICRPLSSINSDYRKWD